MARELVAPLENAFTNARRHSVPLQRSHLLFLSILAESLIPANQPSSLAAATKSKTPLQQDAVDCDHRISLPAVSETYRSNTRADHPIRIQDRSKSVEVHGVRAGGTSYSNARRRCINSVIMLRMAKPFDNIWQQVPISQFKRTIRTRPRVRSPARCTLLSNEHGLDIAYR